MIAIVYFVMDLSSVATRMKDVSAKNELYLSMSIFRQLQDFQSQPASKYLVARRLSFEGWHWSNALIEVALTFSSNINSRVKGQSSPVCYFRLNRQVW